MKAKVTMKRLIIAVLFLMIVSGVSAQLKIGLRAAPQLTWSSPDNKNTSTNGTRVNFGYGLTIDKYFSENYAIGTEFTLLYFGTNLSLDQNKFTSVTHKGVMIPATEDLSYNYRMQYIQIPLLLKMRTKEIGYLRYYAEFGAAAAFLTRAKADVEMGAFSVTEVNINEPDEEDQFSIDPTGYQDGVSSFRGSVIIGGGLMYNSFSESYLTVGIRYDRSFTSFTEDDRWKTGLNGLALNVGFLF